MAGTLLGALLTWFLSLIRGIKAEFILPFAIFLLLGISIGTVEAVGLKKYCVKRSHWVIASSSGFALSIFLAVGIEELISKGSGVLENVLLIVFFGLTVGICQWWILGLHFHHFWLWIFVNLGGHLILI